MCTCPNYMAWQGKMTSNGRPKLDFIPHVHYEKILKAGIPFIEVPCGHCLECYIQYARNWADRCCLESKNSPYNYFITLTYDDAHLPKNGSLEPKHLQLFLKSIRNKFPDVKIRFLACGEYGDLSLRPHYHVLLFNCPLNDLTQVFKGEVDGEIKTHNLTNNTDRLYFSQTIYDSWKDTKTKSHRGMISVGHFSYDTAAYVSQYVTKKIGRRNSKFYEEFNLYPEFMRMSNRPGIGANAFNADLYVDDYVIIPGDSHVSAIPRYFDKLFIQKYGEDVFNHYRFNRLQRKFIRDKTYSKKSMVYKDSLNKGRESKIMRKQILHGKV